MKCFSYILGGLLVLTVVSCQFLPSEQQMKQEVTTNFVNAPTKELFKVFHAIFKKEYDLNSEEGIRRYQTFKANLRVFKSMKEQNPSLQIDSSMDASPEEKETNEVEEKFSNGFGLYGNNIQTLRGHTSSVSALLPLADGFASASNDITIKIWRPNTANNGYINTQTLEGHFFRISHLVNLEWGKFASGSPDNTIKIWKRFNNISGSPYHVIQTISTGFTSKVLLSLAYNSDTGLIAAGSSNPSVIKIWSKDSPDNYLTTPTTIQADMSSIFSLLLLPNSIVAGSINGPIKIWTKMTPEVWLPFQTLTGHQNSIYKLILLSEGSIASASGDSTIKIWGKNNSGQYQLRQTLTGHTSYVYTVAQLADGTLASGSGDNTIKLWVKDSNGNFVLSKTLTGHTSAVRSLTQINDQMASGSDDRTIKIWS